MPTLSGKCSSSLKDDAWTEDDGSWDGLGLSKWDYADTTALAKHATGRQFYNFIEEAHEEHDPASATRRCTSSMACSTP